MSLHALFSSHAHGVVNLFLPLPTFGFPLFFGSGGYSQTLQTDTDKSVTAMRGETTDSKKNKRIQQIGLLVIAADSTEREQSCGVNPKSACRFLRAELEVNCCCAPNARWAQTQEIRMVCRAQKSGRH